MTRHQTLNSLDFYANIHCFSHAVNLTAYCLKNLHTKYYENHTHPLLTACTIRKPGLY